MTNRLRELYNKLEFLDKMEYNEVNYLKKQLLMKEIKIEELVMLNNKLLEDISILRLSSNPSLSIQEWINNGCKGATTEADIKQSSK